MRGFELWVSSDCTVAWYATDKREALRYMARVLKADVTSTKLLSDKG